MANTTRKTTAYDETTQMQKELIALLLKKAGLKEKDVTEIALRRWALKNLDLLTAAEHTAVLNHLHGVEAEFGADEEEQNDDDDTAAACFSLTAAEQSASEAAQSA